MYLLASSNTSFITVADVVIILLTDELTVCFCLVAVDEDGAVHEREESEGAFV